VTAEKLLRARLAELLSGKRTSEDEHELTRLRWLYPSEFEAAVEKHQRSVKGANKRKKATKNV
jgi:hypothetical protein